MSFFLSLNNIYSRPSSRIRVWYRLMESWLFYLQTEQNSFVVVGCIHIIVVPLPRQGQGTLQACNLIEFCIFYVLLLNIIKTISLSQITFLHFIYLFFCIGTCSTMLVHSHHAIF